MQNYSVRYLDKGGRAVRSEFMPFDTNPAAVAYARIGLLRNDVIEIWRDDNLVTRLYREEPSTVVPGAILVKELVSYLSPATGGAQWDSEGGAMWHARVVATGQRSH